MIQRPLYQKQIDQLISKRFIKILIWQRRVGKSTLLKSIIQKFSDYQIIFLDKEQKIYDSIFDSDSLYQFIKSKINRDLKLLAIDEIQNISWRETAILSIYNELPELEIRITGSNSTMLSSELSTRLRWRSISIMVYPFVFSEFCDYYHLKAWYDSMLAYIEKWSMPSVYPLLDIENSDQRRKDLINTIVIKDIVQRYSIRDVDFVYDIYMFLLGNIGNINSIKSLTDYLKSIGKHLSINALQSYIYYLCGAFLVYECWMYDIQGKKIFERLRKYYVGDASMKKIYFGGYDGFVGKNIENIVYMLLVSYGRKVFVGKIWDLEVDFVCERAWRYIYIQVTFLLSDEKVSQREFASLQKITDNRPKYVVTMDQINVWVKDGIEHVSLWELEEKMR